jgi:D-beta-D-heptose 7-phosphate kinase/D-beta-D-heptose 1-phosphate adenosyltransferase
MTVQPTLPRGGEAARGGKAAGDAGMTDDQGFLDFDGAHLDRFIDAFAGQHVVCVGDLMLDNFVYGEAKRISPEAPVPVLRYSRELKVLGGAGNVVRNVAALGAGVACIGVVGDDAVGRQVAELLAAEPRVTASLVAIAGRPTTSKVRYLAGSQQMVRVDREEIGPIGRQEEERIVAAVAAALKDNSVLVLADYAKGVLTDRVCAETIALARQRGLTVVVEPKTDDFARYAEATVIVANADEMSTATRLPCRTDTEAAAATREAQRIGQFGNVITTRSDKGMVALDARGVLHSFPAKAKEVFDVTGAGDTVNAAIALMLGAGASLAQAAYVANEAAGIVVSKLGTSVTSAEELKAALLVDDSVNFSDKISTRAAMADRAAALQRQHRKVGFTNGCFDILHTGHLSLLSQARAACDFLVVGLNSDESVRRLKGALRPINSEHNRALMLAALEMVDGVVIFGEDTPLELITALKPDVLVKGADYRREDVVGGDFVEKRGGQVLLANLVAGQSTTRLIEQIGAKAAPKT